jgi:isopenicillin N synthase-like dioxygenase
MLVQPKYIPVMPQLIPSIDISALFAAGGAARVATDSAVQEAAADSGFMLVHGFPDEVPVGAAARAQLLRLFDLPAEQIRALWRQKFDPTHRNVYRGWFALQSGHPTAKEGIDMGPDVLHGASVVDASDPLREATPLPDESALPGWRDAVAAYYRGMEQVSQALMRSIARSLGLQERYFDAGFYQGLSTLRLIRYPVRADIDSAGASDPALWVTHAGEPRYLTGAAHVDSGFLTLLAQDGVEGLQARHRSGEWLDVPARERTLAVNFGKVPSIGSSAAAANAGRSRIFMRRVRARESRRCPPPAQRHSSRFYTGITCGRRPRSSSSFAGWRACASHIVNGLSFSSCGVFRQVLSPRCPWHWHRSGNRRNHSSVPRCAAPP